MRTTLAITLTLCLAACGTEDKTSDASDSASGSATGSASDATGETSGPTSGPTWGPTSGESASGESGGATTGGQSSVVAEDSRSMCIGQPPLLPEELGSPPISAPGLSAMALGGGKVAVTETEYVSNCGYSFTAVPEETAPNTISITYEHTGSEADCECNFTIDFTLSGLSPGTWTINSGALSAMVDVT